MSSHPPGLLPETDLGFTWRESKSGDVLLLHHGRLATTLRGRKAQAFLATAATSESHELQEQMARLTGNYKRGNEGDAGRHPRNSRG